jgi:hypothetical protein
MRLLAMSGLFNRTYEKEDKDMPKVKVSLMEPLMTARKYVIKTNEYLDFENPNGTFTTGYRIYAFSNFKTIDGVEIKIGTQGGFVQSEDNLSQEGRSWIGPDAAVLGTARVAGDMHYLGDPVVREGLLNQPTAYREVIVGKPLTTRAPGEEYKVKDDNGTEQTVRATGKEILNAVSPLAQRLLYPDEPAPPILNGLRYYGKNSPPI